jgi:hypothetical protein
MAARALCKECGRLEPLRISWSSLKTWETCHQKGFLQRSGKRASLEDQRNYFPGTVVDRISRDWIQNDPANHIGAMPGMVRDYIDREEKKILDSGGLLRWRDKADKDVVTATCVEAATKLESELVHKLLPYEYQADMRFRVPLTIPDGRGGSGTIILNGAMDFIVHRPVEDTWQIYDLKVTRDANYWRKTLGQLIFYDLVNLSMNGKKTTLTGLMQPLVKQEFFPHEVTDEERSGMLQRVVRMANQVWRGDKEPRADSTECFGCNVKHACSKFNPSGGGATGRVSLL